MKKIQFFIASKFEENLFAKRKFQREIFEIKRRASYPGARQVCLEKCIKKPKTPLTVYMCGCLNECMCG